jgi:tRNA1Val (adenine37-N6)-methyltransferase
MKVCTDACLFGAVVADEIKDKVLFDILDIGTGTGLLSIMLAQKNSAAIDAVEIDRDAFEQATENIEQSTFKTIQLHNVDINNFFSDYQYDLIISNPPFFEGDLKSTESNKNAAKHDTALTLLQLITVAKRHLKAEGIFAVLVPYHRINYCIDLAEKAGLLLTKKTRVKQTPKHDYFRGILFFGKQKNSVTTTDVVIKNEAGNYTEAFIQLLKDYYLYL